MAPPNPPNQTEVRTYSLSRFKTYAVVQMDYASSVIQNPEILTEWQGKKIYAIDLVFTRYPYDLSRWRTNYQTLLQNRLKALFRLDSSLFQPSETQWSYIMQTECETEAEAKKLFHGFVVHTRPPNRSMEEVERITFGEVDLQDSTTYAILERHPEWKQMLFVMDWTGSMYPFGASVLKWYRQKVDQDRVKHFVLFNDGGNRADSLKKIGQAGGVYRMPNLNIDSILVIMQKVMRQGNGGDIAENDLEALLLASRKLRGYQDIILVADNRSDVRDLELAIYLHQPIHIILCGVDERYPVHPDYLTLASMSGGSVHTLREDLDGLQYLQEEEVLHFGGRRYVFRDGRFFLLK